MPTTFSFASAGGAAPLATGAPAVPAAEHSPGLDFFAPLGACPDAYRDIKTKSGNIPKQNPGCHQHNKQSPFVSLICSDTGQMKHRIPPHRQCFNVAGKLKATPY